MASEREVIKDITRIVGSLPRRIDTSQQMLAFNWRCSKCGKLYNFDEPTPNPAPCECSSIFFTKIN